jgi:two-component system, NarL family, response regulator DegU
MKVLIADDNRNVRRLIQDYLPESVEEVFECGDGQEVCRLYEEHRPDWVLMDWEMPEIDGITAISRIIARYPQAKICMVTAYSDDALKKKAFRAGAKDFVLKDNLEDLEDVLKIKF